MGDVWTMKDGKLAVLKKMSKQGSAYRGSLGRNQDGDLRELMIDTDTFGFPLKIAYSLIQDEKSKVSFEVAFKTKNGVCYPEKSVDVTEAPKGTMGIRDSRTNFHTDACREIEAVLNKDPQAVRCRCGTDQTDQRLTEIYKKYGLVEADRDKGGSYPAKNVYGKTGILDFSQKMAKLLGGPLNSAYNILNGCDGDETVKKALDDHRLADAPKAVPAEASSSTGRQ